MPSLVEAKSIAKQKFPWLEPLHWQLRLKLCRLTRRLLVNRPVVNASPLIAEAIVAACPYAVGKLGATEASAMRVYFARRRALAAGRSPPGYDDVEAFLFLYSGVFPREARIFDHWGDVYLNAVQQCDVIVSWDVPGEIEVLRATGLPQTLGCFGSLEPTSTSFSWSRALRSRRVLVISPFAGTIQQQYGKRRDIWRDPEILPDFDLLTIRAPLSAGLVPPAHPNWFDALGDMKRKMDGLRYDVALIGAGAFSLPLAAHARANGKVGVHLGGGLQILFGVIGRRWENTATAAHFNEHWCRPSADETPRDFRLNEDGAYW